MKGKGVTTQNTEGWCTYCSNWCYKQYTIPGVLLKGVHNRQRGDQEELEEVITTEMALATERQDDAAAAGDGANSKQRFIAIDVLLEDENDQQVINKSDTTVSAS